MNGIACVLLFAFLFFMLFFRKKIKICSLDRGEKLQHDAAAVSDSADSCSPVITTFTTMEDCLKSYEDCDVTYKMRSLCTTASSIKKIEYALSSNDERNSPQYNPTVLQDIYPTDPA